MCELNENSLICASLDSDEELNKKCVPTQTQIREQLGSKLSDVFFEYVGSEARAWLGLEPPLVGPDTVWINPDARLRNQVAVTPVPEPVVLHLKGLTHASVLEVGQKHIVLLENKHRMEMEEALRKQAEELEEELRRKMADANDSSVVDGSGQCKKVVATLMDHFDSCFNELVNTTQLRMRKECQLKVKEERAEVAAYMLTQLQEEVERRDYELCTEFHDILYSELNTLASRYIMQINQEREIAVHLVKETVKKYEKMIQDMKMEMELCSFVDICRAINQERIDCNERMRKAQCENKGKLEKLLAYIEELKTQNCTLQKMSTERLKRLMQWRKKVRALLQEFQRFINFALKAVPAQSEFLLSVEKLMLKKFPQDSFLLPEDYLHFQNCMKDKLPPCDEFDVAEEVSKLLKESESEQEEEESGETTPKTCQSIVYHEKEDTGLTFDYYKYKSILVQRFASNIARPKLKKKPKKAVCLWKKRSKEVSVDKSNEFYQLLALVGENEKEHCVPVNCFLQRRLRAVHKICSDDPEFAKIILGCPDK